MAYSYQYVQCMFMIDQIQAMVQVAASELPARRMGTESEVAAAAILLPSLYRSHASVGEPAT